MRIELETCLGKELQNELHKLYCDNCKKWYNGEPGCCVGCFSLIDIDIIKDPTKFEEVEQK